MQDVIIDTNIFISVFELKKDFISELEKSYTSIKTLSVVIDELEQRKDSFGKMALKLIAIRNISVIPVEISQNTDTTILEYCLKHNAILCTQDKNLKQQAKNKHLKTIGIRQKEYIE